MHRLKTKNISKFLILCGFLLVSHWAAAQENRDMEKQTIIENRVEYLLENSTSTDGDYTTLFSALNDYYEHPLNLNTASRQDLEDLGLLNDIQINNLLQHIKRDGKLLNLEELQTIDGFDLPTIQRILPFVKVTNGGINKGKLHLKNVLQQAKATLLFRYQRTLEQQEGYSPISSEDLAQNPNARYLGSPDHLYTRFSYKYRRNIDFGITAEKDPGEQFFKGNEKQGFDYYSAHLFLRDIGIVKQLAIGDFQAQFGQGLTMYSGRAFGFSSTDIYDIQRNADGLVPYSSVDENNFLRGGGATIGISKSFDLTAFYSSHKIDANIDQDTSDFGFDDPNVTTITSLQTTGLHRTPSELADKHAIGQNIGGVHLSYHHNGLNLGITGVNLDTKANIVPQIVPYNQFYKGEVDQTNMGINYSYVLGNFSFFGETANSLNYGYATVNGILIALDPHLSFTVLQRYYQKKFLPALSNAIGENTYDNNESGLYFGVDSKLSKHFEFVAYADQYRYPWLSYEADAPLSGYKYSAQLTYSAGRAFQAYFRVRERNRQHNSADNTLAITHLETEKQTNYRFNISYNVNKSLKLKSRAEFVNYKLGDDKPQNGFLLYQDITYHSLKFPLSFSLRYALFQTDSYNARIYAYESNVLYAYSIPAYYYRGSRAYLVLRYSVNRTIDLWLRIAQTVYANKNTIGSGKDEINGPQKTDFSAEVRFRF